MADKKQKEETGTEPVLNVPPTSQVDLAARQENDHQPEYTETVSTGDLMLAEVVPEGYVGTDPMYANYANETDKPYPAEEGPEAQAEQEIEERLLATAAPEEEEPAPEVKPEPVKAQATPVKSGGDQ
jgi:hypothetical protein